VARPKLIPRKLVRRPPAPLLPERATIPDFDRVIHERLRLGIVSALAVNDSLSFSDLKRLLDTSDGNLSVHARKLEDARYIVCHKRFEGRVPRTEYKLTAPGRKALETYLAEMETFIQRSREQRTRL
jgi:DNA-binding HxlR family transcriptional regulator